MSISSSIAAEIGEAKRKEWVKKLDAAYNEKNWVLVKALLNQMRRFYFSE